MAASARIRAILGGADRSIPARLLVLLLVLPSWLFALIVRVRGLLFDTGLRTRFDAGIPVISVGNLTAGGTGKTPAVDYLTKQLRLRGRRVAIISRGYGGKNAGAAAWVSDGSRILLDAATAGDEPLLLARRNPDVPVVVARRRADGIRLLQQQQMVDCVILDDGFQHRQLRRNLDIVLLDARHPFGNGWLQPAGLLREPVTALARADLVIFTRTTSDAVLPHLPLASLVSHHALDLFCHSLQGERRELASFAGRRVFAFAGIADPEAFFAGLRDCGITLSGTLALADHAVYDADCLTLLQQAADDAELFVTTEKDAVKLASASLDRPCYVIGMTLSIDDDTILQKRLDQLFVNGDTQ